MRKCHPDRLRTEQRDRAIARPSVSHPVRVEQCQPRLCVCLPASVTLDRVRAMWDAGFANPGTTWMPGQIRRGASMHEDLPRGYWNPVTETMSRQELQGLQWTKLRTLLAHVYAGSPFYRER